MELLFLALLFVFMAMALGSGFPVAFALPGSAIITIGLAAGTGYFFAGDSAAYFASGGPTQWLTAGVTNFRSIYWEAERDTLIAIPLFIFMGIMLQRSKIAEDLLVTMAQLFGPVPGGLGISVVFVGALLAATTGIVGATVVAMGLISLPAMMRNNYSHSLATGTIAASGTLGQIIPPSIVLIILADQLASAADQAGSTRTNDYKAATGALSLPSDFSVESTSAGEMFLGALVPGLLLVGLYMAYILIVALIRPSMAPTVPYDGARDSKFWMRVIMILFPPLGLIILVLGSIITGIATVNQAGAIGAAGAMVMAGYRLRDGHKDAFLPAVLGLISLVAIFVVTDAFDTNVKNIQTDDDFLGVLLAAAAVTGLLVAIAWSVGRTLRIEETMQGVMLETAKTTALVFIILLGAAMLTAAFRAFGGEELVREFLNGLPGGFWTQFVIVMAVIFVLGFFLDFIEIAVVVVPIVAPILLADPGANISAVWLGVMIGLNIQTSFLTPPFGFALFYLRGVASSAVKTVQMYAGVVPFICLQLLALFIVGVSPELVNYLPNRVKFLSETAPPPSNPKLQLCLEEYVGRQYATNGAAITSAIADVKALDLSSLPSDIVKNLEKGFADAEKVLPLFEAIRVAEAAVLAATPAYRPVHREARLREHDIRRAEKHIAALKRDRNRSPEDVRADIAEYEAEIAELQAKMPDGWDDTHNAFAKLTADEKKARQTYRRTVDKAYEPLAEIKTLLDQTPDLKALKGELDALSSQLQAVQADQDQSIAESAMDAVAATRSIFNKLEGVKPITRPLNNARKALRARALDPERALAAYQKAREGFAEEIAWRTQAAAEVGPGLAKYDAAIRDTIGLRSMRKMAEETALYVANCNASHRDISLSF